MPHPDPSSYLVKSGGSYDLSSAVIEGSESDGLVTVSWRSRWTTETYPGVARCVIEVRDGSGRVVGRNEFRYDTYSLGQASGRQVEVSGVAASVEARCGPGKVSDGSSEYVLENVEFIGRSLFADIRWSSDSPAGDAVCTAIVTSAAGKPSVASIFTLDVPPTTDFSIQLRQTPEPGAEGSFVCEPYLSPEQIETRYWNRLLSKNST